MGATIIEKHVTLDRNLSGPDHCHSLEPSDLSELMFKLNRIDQILGSRTKILASEEKEVRRQKKSYYLNQDVSEGDLFSEDVINFRSPGIGVSSIKLGQLLEEFTYKATQSWLTY